MLHLIVGHRGVGKTAFLSRVAAAYDTAQRVVTLRDLDAEIARTSGVAVSTLFVQHGEAAFRDRERRTLSALLQSLRPLADQQDVYVALGAGYEDDPRQVVPHDWLPQTRVLWLRRLTDAQGRIFPRQAGTPNRPRLSPALSPLSEYAVRFAARQLRYAAWHDDVWLMPEGIEDHPWPIESAFILSALAGQPLPPDLSPRGCLTLLPQQLARPAGFADWLQRRLGWLGVRFELRDDLLGANQLARLLQQLPAERIVRSFRQRLPHLDEVAALCQKNILCDIPLELQPGVLPRLDASAAADRSLVLSLHERAVGESLAAAIARLQDGAQRLGAGRLKLAVEIADLRELSEGAAWAATDPQRHVFLPRTPTARLRQGPERYRWFRTLQAARSDCPLAFFREGDGSSLDQPTLCEHWQSKRLAATGTRREFAAVLGDPVQHSRTPSQHRALFAAAGMPVLAVPCSDEEWANQAPTLLVALGLRYAAVTAPLKRQAGQLVGLPACNSLIFREGIGWHGKNTDPAGLQALLAPLSDEAEVAIWGGGGTLPSLQRVVPQARAFALRTGQERPLADDRTEETHRLLPASTQRPAFSPTVLIWAAGPLPEGTQALPPASWRPRQVFDLDYRECSGGRAYALQIDAEYVSGLAMFQVQAAAQARFFQGSLPAPSHQETIPAEAPDSGNLCF